MKKKKVIVFDLDGTLVNSMDRLTEIAQGVLSHYFGISRAEAKQFYESTSGLAFPDQLKVLYPQEQGKREKAAADFHQKKADGYFDEKPFPDAHATIGYLKEKGYKIVVSSNSEQELIDKLVAKLNILCDLLLGYKKDFAKGKAHFECIFQKLATSPKDLVFIGDSIKDGERALENGIDFIGVEGIFTEAQFLKEFPKIAVISKLDQLKKIF